MYCLKLICTNCVRDYETQRQGWDERDEAFCSFWNAATEEETRTLNDTVSHERLMKWLVNFVRVLNTWRVQAHREQPSNVNLWLSSRTRVQIRRYLFRRSSVGLKRWQGTTETYHADTYLLQAWLVTSIVSSDNR